MRADRRETEMIRQAQADRLEREPDSGQSDAAVDAYRLIHRVIRTAPIPLLPADFASRVAYVIRDHEEHAQPESWIVTIALACAAVAAIVFALPVMTRTLAAMTADMPNVPWPMLLVSAMGLLAVACSDSLLPKKWTN